MLTQKQILMYQICQLYLSYKMLTLETKFSLILLINVFPIYFSFLFLLKIISDMAEGRTK